MESSKSSSRPTPLAERLLGCSYQSLSLFRIVLGALLTSELLLRFRFLEVFYTDDGTMPLRLLHPKIDNLYKIVCGLHCQFGLLWQQQVLLGIQTLVAVCFTIGYKTKTMSVLSWYMYTALILRNTWLYFILDRYFYYLLFYAMFLPLDEYWSVTSSSSKASSRKGLFWSPATIALKLLVVWIYFDAGYGKYLDPKKGWTLNADPLPALDTYTRHTTAAQYIYGLLGPTGLKYLTPTVVYVELFVTPTALLSSVLNKRQMAYTAIITICLLHVGIALCIRNSVLLSLVACSAWCIFLPWSWDTSSPRTPSSTSETATLSRVGKFVTWILVCGMMGSNIWFETIGTDCSTSSLRQIWSTLLQNRWNVFIGAEEYVTWEIAPGRLQDGSVVDVWGRTDVVNWSMPGSGAPCTSTSRPGRWRSFPYLAELEGEEGEALWSYLCRQWDRENDVEHNPGRKLLRYNFFMLQADVLPNMAFSATRKRLVHSYECVPQLEQQQEEIYVNATHEQETITIQPEPEIHKTVQNEL